jgi:hypothetical protein
MILKEQLYKYGKYLIEGEREYIKNMLISVEIEKEIKHFFVFTFNEQ